MNILFIASWYPSKLNAKNGNFIEQHALAVKSIGCNVVVAHLIYSNRILVPEIKVVFQNEIPVYYVQIPRLLKNSESVRNFMFNRLISKLNVIGFTPDILHGHVVYPAGQMALFLKHQYKVPLIYTEHWSGYKSVNSDLFTEEVARMTAEVLGNSDTILPVSDDLGKTMIAKGFMGNYSVVNNTVNTSVFYPEKRDPSVSFRFLHISNFEPRAKNTEGIVRAFIKGQFKDATLTIAGDDDIEKMRDYAKSLDADISKIEFIGALEYMEVADLMRSSDCFLLFSNFENLPCVIAEAHCCGLPVLATNVGGIPEMISESNGLLVEGGDEVRLLEGMREMMCAQNRFNANEIAAVATERYSYNAIGSAFRNHYSALLK